MISSDTDASQLPADEHHRLGGRYALTRFVASGGMAAVWEATDDVLGRRVAVKILHPHLAADPGFLARFRAEARSAARLSQASIVAIFDTVSEPGTEAIVMEFVDGLTLRSFLDSYTVLPVGDAVDLAVQVTDALEAAHDAHIVHRDIKPANILMCPDRRVKVTDFGIAKALEEEDHTIQGTLLGTAKYLSPEQVSGDPVDQRADLYSLGVVLYESLTGVVPFDERTPAATALARLHRDPVPLRDLRADIGPALEQVVLTAMARDPADRYPSAATMRAALLSAVVPSAAIVDPTLIAARDDALSIAGRPAAVVGAAPVDTTPTMAPPRDHLRVLVVTLVILASLGLGLGLVFGTEVGQKLADQVRQNLSGDPEEPRVNSAEQGGVDPTGSADADPSTDSANSGAREGIPADALRVTDFDPEGDGEEHPDRVELVLDGDVTTFWHSERYDNRDFGNLKGGVGLVIELDGKRPLRELVVDSPSVGWKARVFISDGSSSELSDWVEVDGRANISGSTQFDLGLVVGSSVLLWITDLGDELPRPRIEISEVGVS